MNLQDLLLLLFLFFFVILPLLQGLSRRGQQMPPDYEPDEIPLPGEERRPPTQPSQASTAPPQQAAPSRPPAPVRPPASTPPPRPMVSPRPSPPPRPKVPVAQRPRTLEEMERERLARAGMRPTQPEPARPAPVRPAPAEARPRIRAAQKWTFSPTPSAILNGMVWHQVLAEPRSQYWRRVRKSRR
jgi:hypothetical protein